MKQIKSPQPLLALVRQATQTAHGWIVLGGLLVGLSYLPIWLSYLVPRAFKGAISWFLILSMLAWALVELWSHQKLLNKLEASEEDRLLGHILIIASVGLYPFLRFSLWSQAIAWLLVLVGIAFSTWGMRFFQKFPLPTAFIGFSAYPQLGDISRLVWELIVPPNSLEHFMAWSGSVALNAIGQSATADGMRIVLPDGMVEVGWGCNGLDMAITMTLAGLFMGLIYKQGRWQMLGIMLTAAILALVANIPRIMLVTIAHVYWGKWWFDFWHGFWGGQIFVGVLFTLYQYVVLALIKKPAVR
jgi:exosortase